MFPEKLVVCFNTKLASNSNLANMMMMENSCVLTLFLACSGIFTSRIMKLQTQRKGSLNNECGVGFVQRVMYNGQLSAGYRSLEFGSGKLSRQVSNEAHY